MDPLNTPGLHYLPISQPCTPSRASLGTNFTAFILSSLEQHARGQGPVPQPSEQQHTKLILVKEKKRKVEEEKKERKKYETGCSLRSINKSKSSTNYCIKNSAWGWTLSQKLCET